jgi:glycosyltransferase involved in cell wall biosynthesis
MKSYIKIAFILPGSGRSGGVRSTVVAANHLMERGHSVRILVRKQPVSVRGIYNSLIFPFLHNGNHDWIEDFKGHSKIFNKIEECEFDKDEIIIGSGMWASSQVDILTSLPNPKLQMIRGQHISNQSETEKTMHSPIPKVVISSYLKDMVDSYGGTTLGIVPNGVDLDKYYCSVDLSEKDGVGAIYTSHISKDPEALRAVFRNLRSIKQDLPIRVFSAHRRPEEIDKSSFWRLPSIDKSRDIYSRSQVWIMSSKSEGFSNPVLEAMACGCVVVSTDCGGPRDIIQNGENGFLVPVGDVQEITDKVVLLLNNHELRNKMRLNALETVKKFSWKHGVDKLENILQKLVKN